MTINERISQIESELGRDLYKPFGCFMGKLIIANETGWFLINECSWNGSYFTGHRCSKYGEIVNDATIDITNVFLEDEEGEYEDIGYLIDERCTRVYTMSAQWE